MQRCFYLEPLVMMDCLPANRKIAEICRRTQRHLRLYKTFVTTDSRPMILRSGRALSYYISVGGMMMADGKRHPHWDDARLQFLFQCGAMMYAIASTFCQPNVQTLVVQVTIRVAHWIIVGFARAVKRNPPWLQRRMDSIRGVLCCMENYFTHSVLDTMSEGCARCRSYLTYSFLSLALVTGSKGYFANVDVVLKLLLVILCSHIEALRRSNVIPLNIRRPLIAVAHSELRKHQCTSRGPSFEGESQILQSRQILRCLAQAVFHNAPLTFPVRGITSVIAICLWATHLKDDFEGEVTRLSHGSWLVFDFFWMLASLRDLDPSVTTQLLPVLNSELVVTLSRLMTQTAARCPPETLPIGAFNAFSSLRRTLTALRVDYDVPSVASIDSTSFTHIAERCIGRTTRYWCTSLSSRQLLHSENIVSTLRYASGFSVLSAEYVSRFVLRHLTRAKQMCLDGSDVSCFEKYWLLFAQAGFNAAEKIFGSTSRVNSETGESIERWMSASTEAKNYLCAFLSIVVVPAVAQRLRSKQISVGRLKAVLGDRTATLPLLVASLKVVIRWEDRVRKSSSTGGENESSSRIGSLSSRSETEEVVARITQSNTAMM